MEATEKRASRLRAVAALFCTALLCGAAVAMAPHTSKGEESGSTSSGAVEAAGSGMSAEAVDKAEEGVTYEDLGDDRYPGKSYSKRLI